MLLRKKWNRNTCNIMLIYGDEIRMFRNGFTRLFVDKYCLNCNLNNSYVSFLVQSTILTRMQANFGQQGPQLISMRKGVLRTRNSKFMLILLAKYLSLPKNLRVRCYSPVFLFGFKILSRNSKFVLILMEKHFLALLSVRCYLSTSTVYIRDN